MSAGGADEGAQTLGGRKNEGLYLIRLPLAMFTVDGKFVTSTCGGTGRGFAIAAM